MKASELRDRLDAIIATEGDLPVWVGTDEIEARASEVTTRPEETWRDWNLRGEVKNQELLPPRVLIL